MEVIDEDDDKLIELRREFGDEVYKAVTSALTEDKVGPSGRSVVSELWNYKTGEKATLKEGIESLRYYINATKRLE